MAERVGNPTFCSGGGGAIWPFQGRFPLFPSVTTLRSEQGRKEEKTPGFIHHRRSTASSGEGRRYSNRDDVAGYLAISPKDQLLVTMESC